MPKDREFREKILAANPARRRLHKDEDNARRRLERDPGQWLRIRYGMTFEPRQPLFARQGRVCLIREQNPPEGPGRRSFTGRALGARPALSDL